MRCHFKNPLDQRKQLWLLYVNCLTKPLLSNQRSLALQGGTRSFSKPQWAGGRRGALSSIVQTCVFESENKCTLDLVYLFSLYTTEAEIKMKMV